MVPAQGRGALADPAPLAPARRRAARRRRGVRGRAVPQPALAWSRCCSAASATTRGTPSGWSGRCWRPSTTASTTPWCATLATHLGHGLDGPDGELRRNRRYSVAHPAGGAVRVVRRAATVAGHRLARRATTATCAATCSGRPSSGGGCSPRVDAAAARRPARRDRAPAARRRDGPAAARPVVALRPHPDPGHRGRAAARRSASTATSTSSCRSPRPRCGTTLAGLGGVVAARRRHLRRPGRPPAARLARPRRPRAAAHPRRRPGDEVPTPDDRAPAPCSAGSSRTCAPTTPRRTTSAPAATSPTADRSLQVHACHGPARQVDVLREVLVGMLQDDPTLEPRDILVMCPDIESFAPLISAEFGLADRRRPPRAPAAGEARRPGAHQTNPLLAVVGSLLELSGGRVTAADVLDLAATEPCRRRFGFTDDDLDRVSRWVSRAGVRWGLDADLPRGVRDRPVRAGHLAGRPRPDPARRRDERRRRRLLGRVLPLDDVDSTEIDLAGRLAELLDRLDACLTGLTRRHRSPSGRAAARRRPRRWPTSSRRRLAAAAVRAGARPGRRFLARGRAAAAAVRHPRAASRPGWPGVPPARTSAPAP